MPENGPDGRCAWAAASPAMAAYHDGEWGVPSYEDRHLFEMLILEGAQAGLSWSTILNKRDGYRRAFEDFDPERVARYGPDEVERLLADPAIVRNRLKVESAVRNARTFLQVAGEHGSFASYLWDFVDGTPLVTRPSTPAEVPASTEFSDRLSKELRRRGFNFVGTTIVYSYLQSVGLVNDHLVGCPRLAALTGGR